MIRLANKRRLLSFRRMAQMLAIATFMCNFKPVYAQITKDTDSAFQYIRLDEVVISANRFTEKKKNVAQKIDIIAPSYISFSNAQNTGDLLAGTGNIYVQKSQQGGSSPVIRGFEASRVLLVIDGVRMNNAIYRSGHLQNIITVDQNMLERVEILNGPASTLYGSDALGGVIHLRTRTPKLADSSKNASIQIGTFTRYSFANHEKTIHADVNIGLQKIAFLTSLTFSDFGDMKMGANYSGTFRDFGKRTNYIGEVTGLDTVLQNNDERVQKFSGYRQWDILQKVLYRQTEKISHALNVQFSNTTDIPRYDRLQDIRNGTLRYAKWYYGPQKRNLYSYEFNAERLTAFFNQVRANFHIQDIRESRHTREYKMYTRLDSRVENIQVSGFTIDARKTWDNHELSLGTDGQMNILKSVANRTNLLTGAVSKIDTRYPDGKNHMNNLAVFAQHTLKLYHGKLVLNDGVRLQSSFLHSTISDTAIQLHIPYTSITQNNMALTGNVGLVYNSVHNWRVSGLLSSGFRTPNFDDLSKIFESSTALQQLVVPNPGIKPEYTYNLDLGISKLFHEKFKVEFTGFYTIFRNAIVLAPFRFNGQDSILYQGVKSRVLASQNKNNAWLYGFQSSLAADITPHLSFLSTISFTRGRYLTDKDNLSTIYAKQPDNTYLAVQQKVSSKPLDHIPPLFGKTSLFYHKQRLNLEIYMMFNGWKKLDQYNPDGEDNAQYATSQGSPSWITYHVRSSWKLSSHFSLQFAIENIADLNYRYFASGFSAPGRNFIFAIRGAL